MFFLFKSPIRSVSLYWSSAWFSSLPVKTKLSKLNWTLRLRHVQMLLVSCCTWFSRSSSKVGGFTWQPATPLPLPEYQLSNLIAATESPGYKRNRLNNYFSHRPILSARPWQRSKTNIFFFGAYCISILIDVSVSPWGHYVCVVFVTELPRTHNKSQGQLN